MCFFFNVCLAIYFWLCWVLVAVVRGIFVKGCVVFCCGMQALLAVPRGSVVVAQTEPRPRIKPTSPALEGGFLTTGPPGKSRKFCGFKPSNLWYFKVALGN